jgi:hypothetical protein
VSEVARCGELWFLCGPAMDLTQPGFWIASLISSAVTYSWGRHDGRRAAAKTPTTDIAS